MCRLLLRADGALVAPRWLLTCAHSPACSPSLVAPAQVEQLARLQHAAPVWQVEWNMLGTWLAASTDASEVCMWRPDLSGEWLLLNRMVGRPQDDAMA